MEVRKSNSDHISSIVKHCEPMIKQTQSGFVQFVRHILKIITLLLACQLLSAAQEQENATFTRHRKFNFEILFDRSNEIQDKYSLFEYAMTGLEAKLKTSSYSDLYVHKYDNYQELKASGGPQVDQEQCVRLLESFKVRVLELMRVGQQSKDFNIFQFLDAYGRSSSGVSNGNVFWTGEYDECLRLKVHTPDGKNWPTRYCVLSFRQKDWPTGGTNDMKVLKAGICVPKVCDSINYKNKYQLLLDLFLNRVREFNEDGSEVVDLYCLPDEESTIRMWHNSTKTMVTVLALAVWFSILALATYKFERIRARRGSSMVRQAHEDEFGYRRGFSTVQSQHKDLDLKSETGNEPLGEHRFKLYKALAVTANFRKLFSTDKASSLLENVSKNESQSKSSSSSSNDEVVAKLSHEEQAAEFNTKNLVDIRVIEGIKVVSMSYIITGHVLMCCTILGSNGRDMADSKSFVYLMSNLMPAFSVNAFLSITGLLTAYLLLKQNKSHSFITDPLKWLAFILYRYLRVMPMYLLVVLYTKTLSKYMGHGPLWDYGTSSMSPRRACEQESWFVTLLFLANFKSPLEHCIPSAWYLANDFQFFLITPIFMIALHKSPNFGKNLIKICIALSYLHGVYSIATAETEDLTPVAKFWPHGFKTYVSNLAFSYTQPQHRIPAYLVGLLSGYSLFNFEQDHIKYLKAKMEGKKDFIKPEWPTYLTKYGSYTWLLLFMLTVLTPVVGYRIPFNESSAKLSLAVIMPTYHLIFASVVGVYILMATTGYGSLWLNNFLSSKVFKSLARLSLCLVLVNIEVINYFVQTFTRTFHVDNRMLLMLNMSGILLSFITATIVCILFEAPVRGLLNHLVAYTVSKMSNKKREKLQ